MKKNMKIINLFACISKKARSADYLFILLHLK